MRRQQLGHDFAAAFDEVLGFAQGWSLVRNVTLLLANHRTAAESGSGVWRGGHPLAYTFDRAPGADRLLVADVGANGIWGAGKVFAGLGSFFEPVSAGTMLFNFGSVATAGAFVNVFGPGNVTITAFGAGGVTLESYEVTIDTPNGENAGLFLGIGRSSAEIMGLSFAGTGVVLDDLSLSTAVVPLPPAALLLAGGLVAMGWAGRRKKA
jgi:hypothetical protein